MKVNMCVSMDHEEVEHLRKLSKILSLERNEDLSYIDLVREAVKKTYPMEESKKLNKGK